MGTKCNDRGSAKKIRPAVNIPFPCATKLHCTTSHKWLPEAIVPLNNTPYLIFL